MWSVGPLQFKAQHIHGKTNNSLFYILQPVGLLQPAGA